MDDIVIKHITELFEKKDFKKKLVKKLNANINIPIINEKTEKKIIDQLYSTILKTIKDLK